MPLEKYKLCCSWVIHITWCGNMWILPGAVELKGNHVSVCSQEQLSRREDELRLQKALEESKRDLESKGGVWNLLTGVMNERSFKKICFIHFLNCIFVWSVGLHGPGRCFWAAGRSSSQWLQVEEHFTSRCQRKGRSPLGRSRCTSNESTAIQTRLGHGG